MKHTPTIGIDARTIFDAPRRGIGKTLVELYLKLIKYHQDWQFVFFHQYTNVQQSTKSSTFVKHSNSTNVENLSKNNTNVKFLNYTNVENSSKSCTNVEFSNYTNVEDLFKSNTNVEFLNYTNVEDLFKSNTNVEFLNYTNVENLFKSYTNVKLCRIDMPGDRFNFWQEIRLPLAAKINGIDILHCPANTAPHHPLVPMVVTVHDLIPLETEFKTPASGRWARSVRRAVRKARRVLTPSGFTRDKIVQRFGVQADKLIVTPWAPSSVLGQVRDPAELSRVRGRYGLDGSRAYVLGFGAADPRKNTQRILMSWKGLPKTIRERYTLVLLGIQDSALAHFRSQVRELGLSESCVVHGFAEERDLPALLSGATALCYPSLSEGFGLPVLDAFACGTPVLTSTTTSLPEVAGEAAVLVDPSDQGSITAGLCKLLENQELREKLVRLGTARLEKFTWQGCAERVGAVFQEMLSS